MKSLQRSFVFIFAELEKIIMMKNNELASKTDELKARSSQAEQCE